MVKHIVMWKVKEAEETRKNEMIENMKTKLESLSGKIEEVKAIEVGLDFNRSEAAYDVVLYSEFEDREALATYQKHPKHLEVVAFLRTLPLERILVDYEI